MAKRDSNRNVRQNWASRLGVVLAVAGSAVGLGNFLRFPSIATQNGGGAFMIPYFIAFILLGIPMCWVEWSMGRYGGRFSHGSAPGILHVIGGRRPWAKYVGAIGLLGPLLIGFYYIYIESWTLGYAFYAATGKLTSLTEAGQLSAFLSGYQGLDPEGGYFSSLAPAYVFFLITFFLNFYVMYLGITHGIERVSKIAMPLLAIIGAILAFRVLTLGTPDPTQPDWSVGAGLGFIWNPKLEVLKDPKVWLAAAGQIFFTLSVGIGVILTYASYLKSDEDVVLSGLTASATNEFMEVIIGASVVIPAAVVFFGTTQATAIANSGTFNLGFVSMPLIFTKMLGGPFFCFLWFLLLFIAGVTSSISILQPAVSFLEDEFRLTRQGSVGLVAAVVFLFSQAAIFGLKYGVVDEMDFWGGNFLLVLFGLIEVLFFGWIFGIQRAWDEINRGAEIVIPRIFRFIIRYVTPLYMLIILGWFIHSNFRSVFLMEAYKADPAAFRAVLGVRIGLLILFVVICGLIHYSWTRHPKKLEPES